MGRVALWILYHPIHTSYRAMVLDWCGRLEEEPAVGRREQVKLQEMKGISPSCGDIVRM